MEILDEDDFVTPDFTGSLDSAPYFEALPADETCKGIFFEDILENVSRVHRGETTSLLEGVRERTFFPFRDYPLASHMRLTLNAVKLLYPRVSPREGMRRLGWLAFQSMKRSLLGKIVMGAMGDDADGVMATGPRAIALSVKSGRAVAKKLGACHYRYRFEKIFGFLDTYYVGVLEGALQSSRALPRVRIRMTSLVSGDMDVRWVEHQ